jgi:hypothetical protein
MARRLKGKAMEQTSVRSKFASTMPKIRRGLLVAITVLATALGAAACSSHHHHHHHHNTIGWY